MKLGTLLLGTAAGLMVASAAQAADLPGEPVPAAVDYVRVCDTFGAGFFYIPGTETCLDISGRIRFTVRYTEDVDTVRVDADGRVDFDARTSTEYGQLRSFFRLAGGGEDRDVVVDAAFIQLGYLTVGYAGDLFNGDVLYGIDSAAWFIGDQDRLQVTILADDLGGGFYAGVSVATTQDGVMRRFIDPAGELHFYAVAGIADQPWGGVDLSLAYQPDLGPNGLDDVLAIKATADLSLMEGVNARLTAGYLTNDVNAFGTGDDVITLAGAVAFDAGAATVYGGLRYDIMDGDDELYANLGVDYTVVSGLIATAEVSYVDFGPDDSWSVIGRLTRNW
jgi:hypothetical protein